MFIPTYNGKSIPRACLGMNTKNLVKVEGGGIYLLIMLDEIIADFFEGGELLGFVPVNE